MECISCLDSISHQVTYRDQPEGDWKPSPYCEECMEWFVQNQWESYVTTIETETCEKTLKRMIQAGPPTHIREPVGLPCLDPRRGVLMYKVGDEVKSSELVGVYEGEEMDRYLEKLETIRVGLE